MADHDTHDHTGIPGVGGSSDLDAIITASSGQDIADALAGAAAPDSGNVFATMADVGGGFTPAAAKVRLSTADITTTSTSFVDATGVTVTLSTGAHRCLVVLTGTGGNGSNGESIELDVAIDGTRMGESLGLILMSFPAATNNANVSFSVVTDALTAGSHTIKLQWRVTAGTGTLRASTSVTPLVWSVIELGA